MKVRPGRPIVQVLTEQLPDSPQAVLQGVPMYRQRCCRLVNTAAAVEILRERDEKVGVMPLVVVKQRAKLSLMKASIPAGSVTDESIRYTPRESNSSTRAARWPTADRGRLATNCASR
jgi:hypothetical protein